MNARPLHAAPPPPLRYAFASPFLLATSRRTHSLFVPHTFIPTHPRHRANLQPLTPQQHVSPPFRQNPHSPPHPHRRRTTPIRNTASVDENAFVHRPLPVNTPAVRQPPPGTLPFRILGRTVFLSGRFILTLVPILWASYSVCIKLLYLLPWSINASLFNTLRLFFASLFVIPTLRNFFLVRRQPITAPAVRGGIELGFWCLFVNILQIVGLKFISASRSAFLTQLCTVIVPFMAFASGIEHSIGRNIWAASFLSVVGVAMLSLDGVSTAASLFGDALLLLSAFASAFYVIRSKRIAAIGEDGAISALKVISQFILSVVYLLVIAGPTLFSGGLSGLRLALSAAFTGATPLLLALVALLVAYNAIFVSWVSMVMQLKGQSMVSASEAAIIFTSTPLWSAAMAIPLGERFGYKGIVGACLIVFATLMATPGTKGGAKGEVVGADGKG